MSMTGVRSIRWVCVEQVGHIWWVSECLLPGLGLLGGCVCIEQVGHIWWVGECL